MKAEQDMRAKLINEEHRKISDSVNALMRRRRDVTGGSVFDVKRAIPIDVVSENDTRSENTAVTTDLITVDAYECVSDSESSSSSDSENSLPCGIRVFDDGKPDTVTENNDSDRVLSVKSQQNGLGVVENNDRNNGNSGEKDEDGDDDGTFDTIGCRSCLTGPDADRDQTVSPPAEPSAGLEMSDFAATGRQFDRDRGESLANAFTVPDGTAYRKIPGTIDADESNIRGPPEEERSDSSDEFTDCYSTVDSSWTIEPFESLCDETDAGTPKSRSRKTKKSAKETSWCCIL